MNYLVPSASPASHHYPCRSAPLPRVGLFVLSLGFLTFTAPAPTVIAAPSAHAAVPSQPAPLASSKSTGLQSTDPAWLMIMMMTRPKVRAAVLGAKATGAPSGNIVVPRPKRAQRCQQGLDGGAKGGAAAATAKQGAGGQATKGSFQPKKPAKKRLLALFSRPHAAVPASARMTSAQMKQRLLAAQAKAKQTVAAGVNSASKPASKPASKSGQKPAPKLAKPAPADKG